MANRAAKMRFCFNCGAELGEYADYDPLDHCGSRECGREASLCEQQEREETHEQLDPDRGW